MNLFKRGCLRLFHWDIMSFVVWRKRRWQSLLCFAHHVPFRAPRFVCHGMCTVRGSICTCYAGFCATFSCHHEHSRSQGADEPRDDTADPTISPSPTVNSNLAGHRACIPQFWASCGLNTVACLQRDHLQRCCPKPENNLLPWLASNSTCSQMCLFNLENQWNLH